MDKVKNIAQKESDLKGGDANAAPDWRPLSRNNFIWMVISALLIIIGFVLMAGSASGTDQFNPEIFSTRRVVVGPIISFIGFILMAVAILVKPAKK